MSGLGIIAPTPIATVAVSSGSASRLNMLTPSPREVWVTGSVAAVDIDIDFGVAVQFDRIYLGGTNLPAGVGATLNRASAMGGGFTYEGAVAAVRLTDSPGPRFQGLIIRPAGPATRYYRITLFWTGAQVLEIGVLAAGVLTARPYTYGSGRQLIDTSRRTELIDGGFGIEEGVSKAAFRWRFIDLSDEQVEQLWNLVYARGSRRPVIVIEDASVALPRDSQVHYGLFDKFEAYERNSPGDTSWGMAMTEWR